MGKHSDERACVWPSDYFTIVAPSTPGTYFYLVDCYGASSEGEENCCHSDSFNSCKVKVEGVIPTTTT